MKLITTLTVVTLFFGNSQTTWAALRTSSSNSRSSSNRQRRKAQAGLGIEEFVGDQDKPRDCSAITCQQGSMCEIDAFGFAECKGANDVIGKYGDIKGPTDCADVTCKDGQDCEISNEGYAQCRGSGGGGTTNGGQVCREDSKECPDGSIVTRDSYNNCEFRPCAKVVLKTAKTASTPSLGRIGSGDSGGGGGGFGNSAGSSVLGTFRNSNDPRSNGSRFEGFGNNNNNAGGGSLGGFGSAKDPGSLVDFSSPTRMKGSCNGPICSLPSKRGHCHNLMTERYYYNSDTNRCEVFIYGGCQGNENNFETIQGCEAECGACADDSSTPDTRQATRFGRNGW